MQCRYRKRRRGDGIRRKEEIRREKQVGGRTRQGTNRKTKEKLILSSVIVNRGERKRRANRRGLKGD